LRNRESSEMSKKLTELVKQYQESKDTRLLSKIRSLSSGLIGAVYRYYGMLHFPQTILEDITEDCQSLVLVKALEAYKPEKKAEFSTFYTWRVKGHVSARKNYLLRRAAVLLNTTSLDAKFAGSDRTLHDYTGASTNSHRIIGKYKKKLARLFNVE
jgi:hypothetical protein